ASRSRQAAQDVALEAVVHGHYVQIGMLLPPVALAPGPQRLVPGVALPGRHLWHQIETEEARPRPGLALEPVDVELAGRLVSDHAVGHARLADARGQGTRVHAGDGDDAARLEPRIKSLKRAIVGGPRDVGPEHAAAHA